LDERVRRLVRIEGSSKAQVQGWGKVSSWVVGVVDELAVALEAVMNIRVEAGWSWKRGILWESIALQTSALVVLGFVLT